MSASIWDSIDDAVRELAAPNFAAHAGDPSHATLSLKQDQAAEELLYDWQLAHGTGTIHHDQGSYEAKIGLKDNPGGAAGNGKPCSDCTSPEQVAHCIKYGVCVSYQNGGGGGATKCPKGTCDKGGGHCGTGCACCKNEAELDNCYKTGSCTGGGGGGKGGGGKGGGGKGGGGKAKGGKGGGGKGGGLAGPGALGKFPLLGNLPIGGAGTPGAPQAGGSPITMVIIVVGLAIGGYLLWHKLRMAKHQDSQLDKGKKPTLDAAA